MAYGSSSRNGATVRLVVVHTGEGILKAADLAAFLDDNDEASAHAAVDADTLIAPLVLYDRAAWTLGTGNAISDNIELAAFAQMTRDQWLSRGDVNFYVTHLNRNVTVRRPYDMLRLAAQWVGSRCRARGIPIQHVTPLEIRNGAAGICGHNDYNEAYDAGDHWDPGTGFPWDEFIKLANGEEDELSGQGDNILAFLATGGSSTRNSGPDGLSPDIDPSSLFGRVYDMQWALTRTLPILVAAAEAGVQVDSEAVSAALLPALRDAVTSELQDVDGVDEEAVAKAVAARLGAAISAGAE